MISRRNGFRKQVMEAKEEPLGLGSEGANVPQDGEGKGKAQAYSWEEKGAGSSILRV